MLINAVLTALLMWLTLSFWYDAYVQKYDAISLQENVEFGDLLRTVATSLAEERRLFDSALAAPDSSPQFVLADIGALSEFSDTQLESIIVQARKSHTNRSLTARYKHTSFSLPVWDKQISKSRRRLNVYREYCKKQLPLAIENRDTEIHQTIFAEFSHLIELLEKLNTGTSFIPHHNEMITIDLQNFISSIWQLSEAAKQEIALLTVLTSRTTRSDVRVFNKLQSLRNEINKVNEKIRHYGERDVIDQNILNNIQALQEIYIDQYLLARLQLLSSSNQPDQRNHAHSQWLEIVARYSASIDQLGVVANHELQQLAQSARAQGTRRLLVDSAVLVVCLLIVIISLRLTRIIRHIAYHDSLTELANRHHFKSALEAMVETKSHSGTQCAVLLIDLDRFKAINDTFGHSVGDKLLKIISTRILAEIKPYGFPARIGGDEFAVLLNDVDSTRRPLEIAQRLMGIIEEEATINGARVKVGSSVGIALFPDDGSTPTALLKSADIAVYNAKNPGNANICRYNDTMSVAFQQRIEIESDLKDALISNQFELHYQPQLKVTNGRVGCVEALLRWQHPKRGWVSPGEFIPIAEEAGMLVTLGGWVLDEACRQLADWHNQGLTELRVAVNISPQQFGQEDFFEVIMKTLATHNLDPHFLELEVTETIVMTDVERVVDILQRLRQSNIKIAVDDFGTGYSSLQYLQDLPLDILKIDKVFVDGMQNTDPSKSVANSIVQLSKSFDLETIAEGVETEEQRLNLEALGVQHIQGYYYSKPVAPNEIPDVIDQIENRTGQSKKAA